MKTVLILCITLLALSFAPSQQKTVFLCDNGTTEVHHLDKDCSALRRCTHGVVPVSLSEAKEKGLRVCGLED